MSCSLLRHIKEFVSLFPRYKNHREGFLLFFKAFSVCVYVKVLHILTVLLLSLLRFFNSVRFKQMLSLLSLPRKGDVLVTWDSTCVFYSDTWFQCCYLPAWLLSTMFAPHGWPTFRIQESPDLRVALLKQTLTPGLMASFASAVMESF